MAQGTISKSMVLLWENPYTSVAFAAQTVNLDLSGYDMVLIEFLNSPGSVNYYTAICKVGKATYLQRTSPTPNTSHKFWIAVRQATINSNGITFGDASQASASQASSVENSANIPTAIYGIKA